MTLLLCDHHELITQASNFSTFIVFTFADCGFQRNQVLCYFWRKCFVSHDPDPLWRLQTHIWNQYCKILAMLRWYKAKNLNHKEYLTFCTGRERHKPASKGILTDRWCAARCDASPMAMHLNSNLEIRPNLPNHPGLGGAPIEFGWVYSATQSALLFCCICIVLCFRAFSQQQHYVSLKNGFRRTVGILRPSPLLAPFQHFVHVGSIFQLCLSFQ